MRTDDGAGISDGPALDVVDQARAQRRWAMFQNGGSDSRKTATFGDAAAVRSAPFWSFVSLVLLMVLWWAATKTWGFDSVLRDTIEQGLRDNDDPVTQAAVLTQCNLLEDCKGSYSQYLGPRSFPSPSDTWRGFNLLRTDGFAGFTLWEHTQTSLWRVIRGMFFGTLIGVPVGMAMGLSSKLRGFFDTPVELFRPIPPLALLPLFILWFGTGDSASVRLLIFASVWIMIIAARAGVRTVNLSKVRAAYSLGASKPQILLRVILPNALPELFTGIRVALGVSWGTLVAAELVGAESGLGNMIFRARPFFRLDVMVVGVIVIAVIGVLMDIGMRILEARLIPWRGKG